MYKNLFRLTWKNLGCYTWVFTVMEINYMYTDIIVNHLAFEPCTDVVLFVNANALSFKKMCFSNWNKNTQQHIQFLHNKLQT